MPRRVRSLTLNGEDFRQRPIEERRAALSPLVAGVHCILFSDALVAEGALVFAKACQLGLEGIVSKRAGSQYSSGNSGSGSSRRTRRSSGGRDPCLATARSPCPTFVTRRYRSSASRAAVTKLQCGAPPGTARRRQDDRPAADARQLPEGALGQYPRSVQGGIRKAGLIVQIVQLDEERLRLRRISAAVDRTSFFSACHASHGFVTLLSHFVPGASLELLLQRPFDQSAVAPQTPHAGGAHGRDRRTLFERRASD